MKNKLLLVFLLFPCIFLAQEGVTKTSTDFKKEDLLGKWYFHYMEIFDWGEFSILNDSLSDLYNITFTEDDYIETLTDS